MRYDHESSRTFAKKLERGCVEDQLQHGRLSDPLRLAFSTVALRSRDFAALSSLAVRTESLLLKPS